MTKTVMESKKVKISSKIFYEVLMCSEDVNNLYPNSLFIGITVLLRAETTPATHSALFQSCKNGNEIYDEPCSQLEMFKNLQRKGKHGVN